MLKQVAILTFTGSILLANNLQERDSWSDAVDKVVEVYEEAEDDVKAEFDRFSDSAKAEYDRIEDDVKDEVDRVNEKYVEDEKLKIENYFETIKSSFQKFETEFHDMRDEFKDLVSSQTLVDVCEKNSIKESECLEYIDSTRDFFVESLVANIGIIDYATSIFSVVDTNSLAKNLIEYSKRDIGTITEIEQAYENVIDNITVNRGWKLISNPFNREVELDEIFVGTLKDSNIVSIFAYNESNKEWLVCQAEQECTQKVLPFQGIWINSATNSNQLIFNRQNLE